ncbi:MAG: response regulator, partial [Ignavibacteriales bacterium]|nr:response regulator [Ignavibacteriales bacterium]
ATNGPYVLLAVTDTGFGMDKKTIEQIFDPFFTTKETGKGTGLGLSMVHGIVAQHSGFVNVYSEVGKGTTLKIYLPAVERVAAEQKEKTATAIIGGNETILLVEDDTEVREMVDSVLKEFGYTVIVAEDGEDGLRKFQENASAIHMVVSDSVMPKMGGKELHQHIVKIQPDVKFLFVSGYTENAVHHNFILENEVNFLQKPFTPLDLAAKVREVIDRR